jgi:AcrR family transcriptional regulator
MVMRKSPRRALAPADWSSAAYRAIGHGGVDAVVVESLAAELGTTKGSFYWHFKNRDALLEAALDEWEARLTDAVIADLERVPEPGERLQKLVGAAFDLAALDAAAEVALLAQPEQPAVRRRVRRVTQRRLDYMATQLERLGWPADQSRERAILLYYLYVGSLQTRHVLPRQANDATRRQQVELVFEGLAAPPSSDERSVAPGRAAS